MLTIPLECPRPPLCPNCATHLDARNMAFQHNVAFCYACADCSLFKSTLYRQSIYLRHVVHTNHRFSARELTFYAPRIKPLCPVDSFEAIWDPAFVYLDPAGKPAPLPPLHGSFTETSERRIQEQRDAVERRARGEDCTALDNMDSPLP